VQPDPRPVEGDLVLRVAVVDEALETAGQANEELVAGAVGMRAPDGLARHVVHGEDPSRLEGALGELQRGQSAALVAGMRQLVDDHAGDRGRPYDRPVGAGVHETSIVSPDAVIGDGATIEPFCLIGECAIGSGVLIRSHSVIYADVELGDDFECGHHVKIREGSRIGKGVRVGTDCDLQGLLTIGDYARLHSGVFVPQHTAIEELVWIFPRAVLLNDPHPPSDTCTEGPTIRRAAVIGAAATIFPAVEIGEGALIAAGSVVRENVSAGAVVAGVPARVVGETADVKCHHGRLTSVYPWWSHFRRGYPEGVLPPVE
jgi:acetyltransferase-like isoleucine patch superfamily enzyme